MSKLPFYSFLLAPPVHCLLEVRQDNSPKPSVFSDSGPSTHITADKTPAFPLLLTLQQLCIWVTLLYRDFPARVFSLARFRRKLYCQEELLPRLL